MVGIKKLLSKAFVVLKSQVKLMVAVERGRIIDYCRSEEVNVRYLSWTYMDRVANPQVLVKQTFTYIA